MWLGQKTIADVPGIPKPDAKLLAGCRERGRSHVLYIMRGALLPPDGLWRSPRWVGPPVPEIPGIRKPACVSEGRALLQQPALSLALVGLGPGSVAFHRVWWAPRQPRRALPPDVPWCLGWKRNRAVGLKGAESSHPALFPGHPPPPVFERNSVWVVAGGSPAPRAFCRRSGRWRLAVGRAGQGERQEQGRSER